jgi:hypothetical protein
MKIEKESNEIVLYRPASKDLLMAFKLFDVDSVLTQGQTCDLCGAHTSQFYICPELGHNAICKKCFNDRYSRAKWYTEDMHFVINLIIELVCKWDLHFSEKSLDLIDEFFAEHSHRDKLSIRKFVGMFQDGK